VGKAVEPTQRPKSWKEPKKADALNSANDGSFCIVRVTTRTKRGAEKEGASGTGCWVKTETCQKKKRVMRVAAEQGSTTVCESGEEVEEKPQSARREN